MHRLQTELGEQFAVYIAVHLVLLWKDCKWRLFNAHNIFSFTKATHSPKPRMGLFARLGMFHCFENTTLPNRTLSTPTGCIKEQLCSLKRGFNLLIPCDQLERFSPHELEVILSGQPVIDLDFIKKNTVLHGYSRSSAIVQWLWEVLESFSQASMKGIEKVRRRATHTYMHIPSLIHRPQENLGMRLISLCILG